MATGSIMKILRSGTKGNRPSGRAYGEPYVNFAENQFGVINSSGGAQDLLGVPIFSTTNTYAVGTPTNYGGQLYICTTAITTPGAWNAANWSPVASQAYVAGQIPALEIPSGSAMLFYQASAPTGWTQVTTHNDKLLRVVSGTGAGSGGSNAFSSVNAQTVVGGHTLAASELPIVSANTGSVNVITYCGGSNGNAVAYCTGGWGFPSTNALGGSTVVPQATGSYSYTGGFNALNAFASTSTNTGGGAHYHTVGFGIQYVDMIIASKN